MTRPRGAAEYLSRYLWFNVYNKHIRNMIYMFDYSEDLYSYNFHGSGMLELKADEILSYFSYIGYLQGQKIISKKEYKFLNMK